MAAIVDRPMVNLDAFPDEVVVTILAGLPCVDVYSTAPRVCHRWRRLAKDRPAMGPPGCLGGRTPRRCAYPAEVPAPADWLTYAHHRTCPRYAHACRDAVRDGRVDVAVVLRDHLHPFDSTMTETAAAHGDVGMLARLLGPACQLTDRVCTIAAARGHLDVLRFAHEKGTRWGRDTCAAAARGGHLEVLKYAHERGCAWDHSTCAAAAKGGHLACLQYAHTYGCPWYERTVLQKAGKYGRLDCLRWAVEHGCRIDNNPFATVILCDAARRGHLDVVSYLVNDTACPLSACAAEAAADGGHLDVLRCLREAGCPWTSAVCRNAAAGGHLDVLAYAHENGCPWNVDTCRAARAGRHDDCLTYALRHGCMPSQLGTRNTLPAATLLVSLAVGALGVVFYLVLVFVLTSMRAS
ncbi:Ankyrin repeat domain containing protein [Pandoravirus salinus]|uniref:Ankyrin repeat domain containing protein n=1 Tax=Pandoravirus salinus TaxID=1349410 RepID=S4VY99_9VIRU|nr:ankyrin repeat domain [Pandoravirus salinus]AGO85343.1 Ankyrin repeat domain containing protein [Pandoravirus salinus]